MIKIYCGLIPELITKTKFDSLLNEITETSIKRINEKKAGEILLLTALENEHFFPNKPLEYIYRGTKPYLKDYKYYYNISHTEQVIVLALSNQEIGIDVENQKRLTNIHQEVQNIKEWTIKEAAVKYLGTGIKDLKKVSLTTNGLYIDNQPKLYKTFCYLEYLISVVYDSDTEIQIIEV